TPKVFDTLLYLVEHQGVVLDKDELMLAIWPDTVVEENNLNQSISVLRRVLGESRGENRYVATVPGRGYRFVADVKTAAALEPIAERESIDPAFPSHQRADRHKSHVGFIFLAWIGIVALAFAVYYLWPTLTTVLRAPTSSTPIPSASQVRSIAVLPFKPLVADSRDESLEMGMADTLNFRMSSLRDVTVRPISSVRKFSSLEQDPIA